MAEIHETGKLGEDYTASILQDMGYEVLCRNCRVKGGEIDIIARKDDMLAFVEVKTRKKGALVSGEEAITERKKMLIVKAAQRFMSDYEDEVDGRFDVSVVEISNGKVLSYRYYPSAFDASN